MVQEIEFQGLEMDIPYQKIGEHIYDFGVLRHSIPEIPQVPSASHEAIYEKYQGRSPHIRPEKLREFQEKYLPGYCRSFKCRAKASRFAVKSASGADYNCASCLALHIQRAQENSSEYLILLRFHQGGPLHEEPLSIVFREEGFLVEGELLTGHFEEILPEDPYYDWEISRWRVVITNSPRRGDYLGKIRGKFVCKNRVYGRACLSAGYPAWKEKKGEKPGFIAIQNYCPACARNAPRTRSLEEKVGALTQEVLHLRAQVQELQNKLS